jgi:hypothetical protein
MYLVLLGQWNLGDYIVSGLLLKWGYKDCIQNFDGEAFWKIAMWKTKEEVKIKMDLKKIDFEDGKWLVLSNGRLWY